MVFVTLTLFNWKLRIKDAFIRIKMNPLNYFCATFKVRFHIRNEIRFKQGRSSQLVKVF